MVDRATIRVGRELLDIAPRVLRAETTLLAALEPPLTHRQYRILWRVATGTTSLTAMSRTAAISVAAVSESADALMRRGLLKREIDERDRRASKLSLTQSGLAAWEQAEKALDTLAAMTMKGLATDELKAVEKAFEVILSNVKSHLQEAFQKD